MQTGSAPPPGLAWPGGQFQPHPHRSDRALAVAPIIQICAGAGDPVMLRSACRTAARRAFSLTFSVTQRDSVDRRIPTPTFGPTQCYRPCWRSPSVAGRVLAVAASLPRDGYIMSDISVPYAAWAVTGAVLERLHRHLARRQPAAPFQRRRGVTDRAGLCQAGNFDRRKMVVLSTTCRSRLDGPKGRRTMKARSSLRALKQKAGSVVVRRGRRVFVLNKRNPRWNARQG